MTTQHQAPEVTSELRECPWCGGPATVIVTDCRPCEVDGWTDAYSVWCNASVLCGGRKSKLYNDRSNAITAWNTRATQPLSLTVDEIRAFARLREVLAKCPALPIAARPQEHDDWGVIRSLSRNEEGYQPVFARAYSGRYETDIELNAHRRAKTDPTQDTMDLIVEGLNALPALLDRLQSLSLPVDIDRSGLAQEVE